MEWSEKDLCIKCNEGGDLLVCSENGCPLAVHEECMGCPARFDDAGRFYCPYCLYKQAVEEARRAREYALARKKALLLFMDEKTVGTEQHVEENKRAEGDRHNASKIAEANVKKIACNGKSKVNSDPILDQPIQLDKEQNIGNAEEKIQEDESEASAGSSSHGLALDLHDERRIRNEDENKNQEEEAENQENEEEEHETSAASSDENPSYKVCEHKNSDSEDKKIQEEEDGEAISDSSGEDPSLDVHVRPKRGSKRRKPVDRDSDAVSVPSKFRKQLNKNKQASPIVDSPRRSSRRSSSALKTEKVSNEVIGASRSKKKTKPIEVVDASKNSKRSKPSPVKLPSGAFGSGKRKRLFWREEEEECLRVGVEMHSKEANKKIPWRKILDMGRDKFDPTRTPGDLKDKWRNMSTK